MEGFSHFPSIQASDNDWEPSAARRGPSILSDRVWCDLSPDIDRENLTWLRSPGQSASEVSELNDYTFPYPVAGVNQYVFSASAIRDMISVRTLDTTSGDLKDRATAFLATKLDAMGDPLTGYETTLHKFQRLFRPYIVTTSKVGKAHAATIGYNGCAITGLFAGSNLGQVDFHPAATVQTQLRVPSAHLSCMPQCHGADCGIFVVFDTDYSICARDLMNRPYGLNNYRYVVAPTCHEHLVHSYERELQRERVVRSETKYYAYEIAIRRIAFIPKFGDSSLLKIDPITFGVPEYTVDISPAWYHGRYMVCLDETQ